MIGDTSFDMAMARAAGVYALGVTWGFHTREEIESGGAHEIVDGFEDMHVSLTRWRTNKSNSNSNDRRRETFYKSASAVSVDGGHASTSTRATCARRAASSSS